MNYLPVEIQYNRITVIMAMQLQIPPENLEAPKSFFFLGGGGCLQLLKLQYRCNTCDFHLS